VARREQSVDDFTVNLGSLRLAIRFVRPALDDALIPIEAEPGQCVEQLLVRFLGVTLRVGVLDAEHERAADVASIGPVEEAGANEADVRGSGGRRAEANTNVAPRGGRKRRFHIPPILRSAPAR